MSWGVFRMIIYNLVLNRGYTSDTKSFVYTGRKELEKQYNLYANEALEEIQDAFDGYDDDYENDEIFENLTGQTKKEFEDTIKNYGQISWDDGEVWNALHVFEHKIEINKEVLKSIKHDVECLNIDYKKDNNYYHYGLAIGNLKDLIRKEESDLI